MIVTRWIVLRVAAIVLATVLLQLSFFSYFGVFGSTPNVVPVVIACVGLLSGAVPGAVVGFATGLVLDSSLLETLGASSLVLLSVGYLAGRYRESFEIENRTAPALVTGALVLFAAAGGAAIQITLGVDSAVSGRVVAEVVAQGVLGFLLAYPVYPVVRLVLRPALVLEEQTTARPTFRGRRLGSRGDRTSHRGRARSSRRGGGAARRRSTPARSAI